MCFDRSRQQNNESTRGGGDFHTQESGSVQKKKSMVEDSNLHSRSGVSQLRRILPK